jgi:superfamily II DNA/RNA helicase
MEEYARYHCDRHRNSEAMHDLRRSIHARFELNILTYSTISLIIYYHLEYVLREVMKQGFAAPSPIQSQGWPMALLGRDMIGISATGSG